MAASKKILQVSDEAITSAESTWVEVLRCQLPEDGNFLIEGKVIGKRASNSEAANASFVHKGNMVSSVISFINELTYLVDFETGSDATYHGAELRFTDDGDEIVMEVRPDTNATTEWYGLITVTLN